tara:strand:+ start:901 stop:1185 length:285 start_codon:yes stop_codon:yes gene_type:complete
LHDGLHPLGGWASISRKLDHVIHEYWIDLDGTQVYFTIIEGPDEGLLVKPGDCYGTANFIRGNYTYVSYEYIKAPYQLKGSDDSRERSLMQSVE